MHYGNIILGRACDELLRKQASTWTKPNAISFCRIRFLLTSYSLAIVCLDNVHALCVWTTYMPLILHYRLPYWCRVATANACEHWPLGPIERARSISKWQLLLTLHNKSNQLQIAQGTFPKLDLALVCYHLNPYYNKKLYYSTIINHYKGMWLDVRTMLSFTPEAICIPGHPDFMG